MNEKMENDMSAPDTVKEPTASPGSVASRKKELRMKNIRTNEKVCKVLYYDKNEQSLSVLFDRFGIKIHNAGSYDGSDNVTVKYTGTIGNADFRCSL